MKTTAIFPGTFDPITRGHIDLITRGAQVFEKLIVAVAESEDKATLFPLATRVTQIKSVLSEVTNVSVLEFSGLLVDFAKANQASIILRGLRRAADFDYEVQLASMNRQMQGELETVFLPTSGEYTAVSSSLVREIATMGGGMSRPLFPQTSPLN